MGDHATRDIDGLSSHVARQARSEKTHDVRDVLRLLCATHWDGGDAFLPMLTGLFIVLNLAWLLPILLGVVFIRERQVGIVVKKFGKRSLPWSALDGCRSRGAERHHRGAVGR